MSLNKTGPSSSVAAATQQPDVAADTQPSSHVENGKPEMVGRSHAHDVSVKSHDSQSKRTNSLSQDSLHPNVVDSTPVSDHHTSLMLEKEKSKLSLNKVKDFVVHFFRGMGTKISNAVGSLKESNPVPTRSSISSEIHLPPKISDKEAAEDEKNQIEDKINKNEIVSDTQVKNHPQHEFLRNELEKLTEMKTSLEISIAELEVKRAEFQLKSTELSLIEAKFNDATGKQYELLSKISKMEREIGSENQVLNGFRGDYKIGKADSEKRLADLQSKYHDLLPQLAVSTKEYEEVHAAVTAMDKEIAPLKNAMEQITQKTQQLERLQARIKEINEELT